MSQCNNNSTRVKLLGSNKTVVIETVDKSATNAPKHKSSTAPNLIHSADASMLHIAFETADYPFSLIHDSVLTRACDMGKAVASLKQTYADVFSKDILGNFITEVGLDKVGMTADSLKGDLDPSCVLQSDFYFS